MQSFEHAVSFGEGDLHNLIWSQSHLGKDAVMLAIRAYLIGKGIHSADVDTVLRVAECVAPTTGDSICAEVAAADVMVVEPPPLGLQWPAGK